MTTSRSWRNHRPFARHAADVTRVSANRKGGNGLRGTNSEVLATAERPTVLVDPEEISKPAARHVTERVGEEGPILLGARRAWKVDPREVARDLGYKLPRLARQFEFEGRVWRETALLRTTRYAATPQPVASTAGAFRRGGERRRGRTIRKPPNTSARAQKRR